MKKVVYVGILLISITFFPSQVPAGLMDKINAATRPPEPDNPYRWYDYVTNQERAAINREHADLTAKIMKECNIKPSGL